MADTNGRTRVIVEHVGPQIDKGRFPIKRVVGEKVNVTAHVFSDGHDQIRAELLFRPSNAKEWTCLDMRHVANDEWTGKFQVTEIVEYRYTVRAWVDHFETWRRDLGKKCSAGQDVRVDLLIGADLLEGASRRATGSDAEQLARWARELGDTAEPDVERAAALALSESVYELARRYPDRRQAALYTPHLGVSVNRVRALYSTWYELFPRSCGTGKAHGSFADVEPLLPDIARQGFDVLYLPPIHPIGRTHRKGRNNAPVCEAEDPGSPWAIGGSEGGHKAVHPGLGTLEDFRRLVKRAGDYGVEIALDLAFQCSPDHPYVKEHPEWFRWRPDGTVQFAENPPKKYEDILPLNFETDHWRPLWEELKSVVLFWIAQGVRIFRVDNPHTKPFAFWEWLIREVRTTYPETIFLAEAFTRPKIMQRLAKLGFDQSYTYFTWRNTKWELTQYLTELTRTEVAEYMRPNFWPNTPDILPEYLRYGGRSAFVVRLVLAGTLSSNYGIYGPAFELCVHDAVEGKEEYLDSEKYEIKDWDWQQPGNIRAVVERLNRARRENPCLQQTRDLMFLDIDNEMILAYAKCTEEGENTVITVVNLDPYHKHAGWIAVPLAELGIEPHQPYMLHDLLSNDKYIWQGRRHYIELDPQLMPAHVLRVHRRLRRETDFDYFM